MRDARSVETARCARCGDVFVQRRSDYRFCKPECRKLGQWKPGDPPLPDLGAVDRLFDARSGWPGAGFGLAAVGVPVGGLAGLGGARQREHGRGDAPAVSCAEKGLSPHSLPATWGLCPAPARFRLIAAYMVEGTATSGAAGVAEAGNKPESTLAYSTTDEPVKKIATTLTISDEMLEDGGSTIQSYLKVDGSGQVTGAVDFLWGNPVVITTALGGAGTALVGAFDQATMLGIRSALTVEASNQHASYFSSNLVMIRAEMRMGLCVFRPSGVTEVRLS